MMISKVKKFKYSKKEVDIKWYYDGTLNVSYNCIDRHAKKTPDKNIIGKVTRFANGAA